MNRYVVANLKMNQTAHEVNSYLKKINDEVDSEHVIICPTSIYIPYFLKQNYKVGLQNIFFHSEGAYTGEISPLQAMSLGVRYTLVGHSERRTYFEESDLDVNKKIKEALNYHMKIILCIGETNEERNMLKTDRILKKQLTYALRNINPMDYSKIMIAYEPVWALGTGNVPTEKEITTTITYIKELLQTTYHWEEPLVLYGGSVNEKNITHLNKIAILDGFLVGGASQDPKKLLKIIDTVLKENQE